MVKSFALVALLCLSTAAAASPIVDTGTPTGDDPWALNFFEYYAAKFTISDTSRVQSVEGYMRVTRIGLLDIAIHKDQPFAENVLYHSIVDFSETTPLGWYGLSGVDWLLAPGTYWVSFKPTPSWVGPGVRAMMPGTAPSPLDAYLFSFTRDSSRLITSPDYPYYMWDDIEVAALGVRLQGVAVPDDTPTWCLLVLALLSLALHGVSLAPMSGAVPRRRIAPVESL